MAFQIDGVAVDELYVDGTNVDSLEIDGVEVWQYADESNGIILITDLGYDHFTSVSGNKSSSSSSYTNKDYYLVGVGTINTNSGLFNGLNDHGEMNTNTFIDGAGNALQLTKLLNGYGSYFWGYWDSLGSATSSSSYDDMMIFELRLSADVNAPKMVDDDTTWKTLTVSGNAFADATINRSDLSPSYSYSAGIRNFIQWKAQQNYTKAAYPELWKFIQHLYEAEWQNIDVTLTFGW